MAQTRVNGGAAAANHIGGDLNFVKVPCGGAVNGSTALVQQLRRLFSQHNRMQT